MSSRRSAKKNATTIWFHFADDGDGGYCHHVDVLACRSTPCFVVFRRAGCFISLFRDVRRHVQHIGGTVSVVDYWLPAGICLCGVHIAEQIHVGLGLTLRIAHTPTDLGAARAVLSDAAERAR